MIVSIAWIVLCFVWLLIESDWLRVRLPVGNLPVKRNGRWQFGRFGLPSFHLTYRFIYGNPILWVG